MHKYIMNPPDSQFIGYVDDPVIHDAIVTKSNYQGIRASLALTTDSGQILEIESEGVVSVKCNRPEGMMLYSLSEMRHPDPRLFIFADWEDESEAATRYAVHRNGKKHG